MPRIENRNSHRSVRISTDKPKKSSVRIRVNAWPVLLLLAVLGVCINATGQAKPRPKRFKPHSIRVFTTNLVTLPSDSPLYTIRIMVRTGSAYDPPGKEGTSDLTARMLI